MHETRRNAETRVSVIVNPCENGRTADPRLPVIGRHSLFMISHVKDTHVKITF